MSLHHPLGADPRVPLLIRADTWVGPYVVDLLGNG